MADLWVKKLTINNLHKIPFCYEVKQLGEETKQSIFYIKSYSVI
jgi:hypothetical protein